MGSLIYGNSAVKVDFDDRVLAHLQIVFATKLRRGESFFFSWLDAASVGEGRGSFWAHPSIPLYFKYSGSRVPALNRSWLEHMVIAAGSNAGLTLAEEPRDIDAAATADNSAN